MKTKTAEERKEQTETLLELYRNSDLLNGILVKHPQDAVQIQNEVIELMRLAIYTSPSQLPASVPTDWWDDERFIELKNAHLDIICKGILEYNGTGKFGSPELQKIADIVHRSLNHPPVIGEGEKESKYHFARGVIFTLRSCQAISIDVYLHWIEKLNKDENSPPPPHQAKT